MSHPPKTPWPGSGGTEGERTVFRPASRARWDGEPQAPAPPPPPVPPAPPPPSPSPPAPAATRLELRPLPLPPVLPPGPADRPVGGLFDQVSVAAEPPPTATAPARPPRRPAFRIAAIGGCVLAIALAIGYAAWDRSDAPPPSTPPAPAAEPSTVPAATADPLATAQQALDAGLGSVPCAWLSVDLLQPGSGGVELAVSGVAGNPGDAQQEINRLLAGAGVRAQTIDFTGVAPIKSSECAPIDAFAQIRSQLPPRLTVAQRTFEMSRLPEGVEGAGTLAASAIVEIDLAGLASDATLLGLDDTGAMSQILPDRSEARVLSAEGNAEFREIRPEQYRFQLETSHHGWSGLVLLTGRGPFPQALLEGGGGTHDGGWQTRFLGEARRQGWKAEMVWYRTADDVPNPAPPPPSAP